MKNPNENRIKIEQEYVAFLKKSLESKHFRENVTPEKYEKTRRQYDKAKLKLRMWKQGLI